MSSVDESGNNELEFLANEVSLNPVILSRSRSIKRDVAVKQILCNYEHYFGIRLKPKTLTRKLTNMKSRLKRKININSKRLKDKRLKLLEYEKLLLEVMESNLMTIV